MRDFSPVRMRFFRLFHLAIVCSCWAARMISTSATLAGFSLPSSSVVVALAAMAAICSGVWCAVAMACRVAGSSFAASFKMICSFVMVLTPFRVVVGVRDDLPAAAGVVGRGCFERCNPARASGPAVSRRSRCTTTRRRNSHLQNLPGFRWRSSPDRPAAPVRVGLRR